jgi:hypothetical protein
MSSKDAKLLTLLICSVGAFFALNLLYFPLSVPWMMQHSGGVPVLDGVPFRNVTNTYEILDALGSAGRKIHLYFIWTVDLVLPLLFGWSLFAAIGSAAERAFGEPSAAGRLRWLAVIAVIADYLENVTNSVLLVVYPDRVPLVAVLSGLLTSIKFALYGVCVLVGILTFSIAFARRRKTRPPSVADSGKITSGP